jgi:vancomycin resistance protein YoaR
MLRRGRNQGLIKKLFMAMGVLIVMLIVVLIVIVTGGNGGGQQSAEVVDSWRFVKGVSVGGIDVSGMTVEQASKNEQITAKAQEAYSGFSYTFTVQGKQFTYNAEQLGLDADVKGALKNAVKWGNAGDGAAKDAQRKQAEESGKDFPAIYADKDKVAEMLQSHKAEFDIAPQDATLKVAETYTPGQNAVFVDEVKGVDVSIAQLTTLICDNINSGNLNTVEAPSISIDPKITVDELKANVVMTRSWSSSYKKHSSEKRVTNIKILAGLVNGSVIAPGQNWSVNETAGPRNATTSKQLGWTEADGIENGRYSEQYGGGVCQVSSTIYNTAIRSELEIVQRTPHSWPSDYIDKGMDATISTGGPDLVLRNPFDYPVLLVCHVDETEKTVTVEIYGPPIKEGYTIEFKAQQVQTNPPPPPKYNYNATALPDGTPINPNEQAVWIEEKIGSTWKVYKYYEDKDGNQVGTPEFFTTTTYKPFQGVIYCNFPETGPVTSVAPVVSK